MKFQKKNEFLKLRVQINQTHILQTLKEKKMMHHLALIAPLIHQIAQAPYLVLQKSQL